MNKLFLLLILSFFSAQGIAGSCPDGSEPVKSISDDGTYYVTNLVVVVPFDSKRCSCTRSDECIISTKL